MPAGLPAWLGLLAAAVVLVGLAGRDLWTPDEPREAAIMLGMSRSGNWLIPDLAGEPFVEKPPLYYIVGAAALRLAGPRADPTITLRYAAALWALGALAMTALLARRVLGPGHGAWAAALLATLPGFVQVSHWLLTDNALLFFITASFWCLAEAYLGNRLAFLPAAALCAGGAFWSKGLIGPLLIAPGALALGWGWARREGVRGLAAGRSAGLHAAALGVFLGAILGWIIPLRLVGGPALWHAWFWDNHVGRLLGSEPLLGHIQPFWYYLAVLPVYLLPWLAVILAGLSRMAVAACRKALSAEGWFLAAWALGGLALLSGMSTKRDIYLSAILPAFAVIGAGVCAAPPGRWLRVALRVWAGCLAVVWLAAGLAPWLRETVRNAYGPWAWREGALAVLGAAGVAQLAWRKRPLAVRILALTVLLYLGGLALLFSAVNRVKNYGPAFRGMAAQLAADPGARVAGWQLDETTRGGFYVYCDLVFPPVSDINELKRILAGRHGRWNGVLALDRRFPPESVALPPWRVRGEVVMGANEVQRLQAIKQERRLQWIEGAAPP